MYRMYTEGKNAKRCRSRDKRDVCRGFSLRQAQISEKMLYSKEWGGRKREGTGLFQGSYFIKH